uniref:RRM domain-containing protein n=1 Tax=Aegilops tauschii subsp. strangulata TaxID=200361 RepID=A0A453TF07_AEGTS
MSHSNQVRYTARSITPPADRDSGSKSPPPRRRAASKSPPLPPPPPFPPKGVRTISRSPPPSSTRRSVSRSPPPKRRGRSRSRSRSRSRNRSRSRQVIIALMSRDKDDVRNPGNNLYVTGLSTRTQETDLEKFFSKEGKVKDCRVVIDPRTKESRGFAFVTMENVEDARRCIKYLHRTVLEGRLISVAK